jgi:hypothetical protein
MHKHNLGKPPRKDIQMSGKTQIRCQYGLEGQDPFERQAFEFGGQLTLVAKEPDPSTGYHEVRFRTLREEDKKPVYPKAFAAGEVVDELAECKRLRRPVLVSGHVEVYVETNEGKEKVKRRYVIDEIISTNSTNRPGEEGDRDVVEYAGTVAEVSDPKATNRRKTSDDDPGWTFRTVAIQQPGVSTHRPALPFGVFELVGAPLEGLEVGNDVCVVASEGSYFRKTTMCRSTNILGVVVCRSTPQAAESGEDIASSENPTDGDQAGTREPSGSLSEPIF